MKSYYPLLATIFTTAGNYIIPSITGKSIGGVAGTQLEASPASWAFSIWGFIYIGLLHVTSKIADNTIKWNNMSIALYIISCVLNLSWIYCWLTERLKISPFLLSGIAFTLTVLWFININSSEKRIYQNIISAYVAWTVGASVLNFFIVYGSDNVKSSKYIIYLLSASQILWQIFQNGDSARDSLSFPIVGVWTGLAIVTNDSVKLNGLKGLPFIVSILCSLYHYTKIDSPNIYKLLFQNK